MHFKIRHNYPIGRAAFWQLFFDDKYNKQLYVDVLRFGLYEILDNDRHDDGSVERRLLLEPSVEIPDLVRKVVGQRVRYEERGHFDPATQEWSYRVIPMSVPDKVEMHGKDVLGRVFCGRDSG